MFHKKPHKFYNVEIEGTFVPILQDIIESKAVKELTPNARWLLVCMTKVARIVALTKKQPDQCKVDFHYAYSEAKKDGFATSTFSVAKDSLRSKGFIDLAKQGGLRGLSKSNNEYRLSNRWRNHGTFAFLPDNEPADDLTGLWTGPKKRETDSTDIGISTKTPISGKPTAPIPENKQVKVSEIEAVEAPDLPENEVDHEKSAQKCAHVGKFEIGPDFAITNQKQSRKMKKSFPEIEIKKQH